MTNNSTNKIRPAILIILDGFGIAPPSQANAITLAKMPVFKKLISLYPSMSLQSSGEAIGLSWGEPGNSEVGHLNLGAGKIVWQNLPLINRTIMDGSFFKNDVFLKAIAHVKENKSDLHLIGLTSNGRVHSSIDHLYALLELAAKNDCQQVYPVKSREAGISPKAKLFNRVYIHAILDGRDTPHNVGKKFIKDLLLKIKSIGVGQVASISGRFWAMDRDNHWKRIETAYLAMTKGLSEKEFSEPIAAVEASYKDKVYDEQFQPVAIVADSKPVGQIKDNDAVIFFNFRSDRARELTKALVSDDFQGFKREKIKNLFFATMTEYEKGLPVEVAFPPVVIKNPIAKVISDKGLNQLHIAETEKYAHVTFFFNGGREQPFKGEKRILIPSPRIAAYNEKPEMSANEIMHQVLWAIDGGEYKFIVVNFANPDMVSHTGDLPATIKALEIVDAIVGQIVDLALKQGWVSFITSDHGNAEILVNLRSGEIDKEHNISPVPFVIVDPSLSGSRLPVGSQDSTPPEEPPDLSSLTPGGVLADVAPSVLKLMGIEKPSEMTGTSLI